jgi:hypothetical protein
LNGITGSSPGLADVEGNGSLDVVQGADNGVSGSVWVINGANGLPVWHQFVVGRVIGSVVTADLSGAGYQDVLVPTTHGVEVFDGRSGAEVTVLGKDLGFQGSPLVTDDPNGEVGITIAGYNGANEGAIEHFEIPGSNGLVAVSSGSWPMFHHDPQLTGVTSGLPAQGSIAACDIPAAAVPGYNLATANGAVLNYGQPPCTPSGAQPARPDIGDVVGMAMAPDMGGYWLAVGSGAVYAFGEAQYYGSMSGQYLNTPIVGITANPDGHGYWLVAADGGVYAYGDARYFGSLGSRHLNAPIVAMAATPDGHGYWLAAADGGVFGFGDAHYHGSMSAGHLNSPVVGIATDIATGSYWLVAADGGVFAFGAPYEGSVATSHLSSPVVGMAPTADGRGYWLVAADGTVFGFGDADYPGSTSSSSLNGSAVAIAGYFG